MEWTIRRSIGMPDRESSSIGANRNPLSSLSTDPRVNDWPMMSSPLPSLGLCLFYAYFSKVLGPRLMAGRQPFNLRKILIVYNFFQTIFSAWIFYEVSAGGGGGTRIQWQCSV